MARQPAARRFTPEMFTPDPLSEATLVDQAGVAEKLSTILEGLRAFDQNSVMGYLYRKPSNGVGKFEFAERMIPPEDAGDLMEIVKEKYGGGEYRLQIFAGGKTRGNCEFPIMGPPKPIATSATPPAADPMGGNMFAMMLNMQAEARREQMMMQAEARREAAEMRREQQERDARRDEMMWKAAAMIVPAALPMLFAGREKLSDLVALMNANKAEPTNLKDTVETMVLVKKLFGDDKAEGFNPDDIAGSLARLAGPVAAGLGRAFGRQPAQEPEAEPPAYGDGRLTLPGVLPAPETAAPATPSSPVIALIRPHVLYFYAAQHDPALAAEAVVDIMARSGVTDGDVNDLVAAYLAAPDWKADLAAQGIDLRAIPEWADEFLAELVNAWPERQRHGDDRPGGAGGLADAQPDAPAGAAGVALDAASQPGA